MRVPGLAVGAGRQPCTDMSKPTRERTADCLSLESSPHAARPELLPPGNCDANIKRRSTVCRRTEWPNKSTPATACSPGLAVRTASGPLGGC
jgi:hypothetical protein